MPGGIVTMFAAFMVNLPLGLWRCRYKRFSLPWFVLIHLSIPLIFWLRNYFNLDLGYLPFTIGSAILGQFLGWLGAIVLNKKKDKRRKHL